MARYHLIGIGGVGMSVVAELLAGQGHVVSGSDRSDSATLEYLRGIGIDARAGHLPQNVEPGATVVLSSAIRSDNPEYVRAQELGLEMIHRSEALAYAARGLDFVAVAGAHGKTTTSGMLAVALREAGTDPSYAVGSTISGLGSGASLGSGKTFVAEVDESDNSYLRFSPRVSIVTNIAPDHLAFHGTVENLYRSYRDFAARLVDGGLMVICSDDVEAASLAVDARAMGKRVRTYGFEGEASEEHVRIEALDSGAWGSEFKLHWVPSGGAEPGGQENAGEQRVTTVRLSVPGRHQVLNAAASWCAGVELGVAPDLMARSLAAFKGTGRRFEVRGEAGGVCVIDDYAHMPEEIDVTIATARLLCGQGRVLAVFQPHLYSRTRDLAPGFARALAGADYAAVTAVLPVREEPIPGITERSITDLDSSGRVFPVPADEDAIAALVERARPGDVILTIGAGTVTHLGPRILRALEGRAEGAPSEDRS